MLTLASRWPYRARMLYNWDAVQFALALTEFDVAKHQPHPPGYLLYVGLGRLANRWVGDPALAYVGLAMLFSAATTFVVYWLARRLYDRTTAVAAAALLAVSPLFWFYGSVGLTYAGEAFGASLVAWWAWGALEGRARYLYLGALTLGLVGGMRQSVLVLIFPLWLGAAVLGMRSWRRVAAAGGVLAAAVLAWLLPTIWLSGGLAAYVAASTQLYGSVVLPTSVLGGSLDVTFAQARYLAESVIVGLGPLALAFVALPAYVRRAGWGRQEWFLLAWILPPAAFYTLVHFGQAGYVLTFLPALVILLARALVEAVAAGSERLRRPNWRWALTAAALVALVLVNTGFFARARPAPARVRPPGRRSLDLAGPRRDPRLDHEPDGGGAARARGGDPHLRRDDPRGVRSRRHGAAHGARQSRARIRGCVTPCSTCPSIRSTRCSSATRPATTRPSPR